MGKLKSLEHKIKAGVFALARGFLKRGSATEPELYPRAIRRVLFLRPEKIGDMVISLPIFDALRRKCPHISISILGSPVNHSLIKDDPRFDAVFLYTKSLNDFATVRRMRAERFDVVLDMINDDSVTTLFLSQLIGGDATRIGIGKKRFAEFYDFNYVHPDGYGDHIVEDTLGLLLPFGIRPEDVNRYAPPHISLDTANRMKALAQEIGVTGERRFVGFNLSAGKPNRIWAVEKARQLVRAILDYSPDIDLLLIVTPKDRDRGEAVLKDQHGSVSMVPPGLSLLDVSALIAQMEVLISPDTSLIHIARSFQVPVVGLYSRAPKNLRLWRPLGQPDGAVVGDHIDDIFDITPEQVFERTVSVLSNKEAPSA
ncbi:MAG: glycosyltransferase family 9 protein [candidate division Zixibacteria bacterium]|nr:glycosyltransferase family 9 protein [candidate division Zixibacteria bacterium]